MKSEITLEIYYDAKEHDPPNLWDWKSLLDQSAVKVLKYKITEGEVCWFCQGPIKDKVVWRDIIEEGRVPFHNNCAPLEEN